MSNAGYASNRQLNAILDSTDQSIYEVTTKADGPSGSLPLTNEMLTDWPSGDLFGLTQNAGMGWTATEVARDPYLILSTQGGLAGPMASRSRWAITRATGKLASWFKRPPRSCGGSMSSHLPAWFPTPATAGPRGPPG